MALPVTVVGIFVFLFRCAPICIMAFLPFLVTVITTGMLD